MLNKPRQGLQALAYLSKLSHKNSKVTKKVIKAREKIKRKLVKIKDNKTISKLRH